VDSIRALEAGTYEWTRAQNRRGRSELIVDGRTLATLAWDRAWNSNAHAESDGQAWSFRRHGVFRRTITIEPDGQARAPRVFPARWGRSYGIVTSSGSTYRFVPDNFSGSRWKFVAGGADDAMIRSHRGGVFWAHYKTEITARGLGLSDLPFLACLGAWLHTLLDRDVAISASAGASS
jgi:hypothetical protein